MKEKKFLFDTHALLFWINEEYVSAEFIDYFDKRSLEGNLYISSASIWEIALLKKKGKIEIDNLHEWHQELINNCPGKIIDPTSFDMIDSTLLPDFHKDPFDRLLIAQAVNNNASLVTQDKAILKYTVKTFWV